MDTLHFSIAEGEQKIEALHEIQEVRAVYRKMGISAQKIHEISKKELESKNERDDD